MPPSRLWEAEITAIFHQTNIKSKGFWVENLVLIPYGGSCLRRVGESDDSANGYAKIHRI